MFSAGEAHTSPQATPPAKAHTTSQSDITCPRAQNYKNMKPLTETQKQRLIKAIKYLALAIATSIAMALGLTSCNVTRTITTESRSVTKGDTAIIIQSKTIESYNAKKN